MKNQFCQFSEYKWILLSKQDIKTIDFLAVAVSSLTLFYCGDKSILSWVYCSVRARALPKPSLILSDKVDGGLGHDFGFVFQWG